MPTNDPNWQALLDLARALSQQNDFAEILRLVTRQAADLLRAEMALIFMINPRTRDTVKTIYRIGQQDHHPRYHAAHQQLAGWVMTNDQALLSTDIRIDARFAQLRWHDLPFKSLLCVPLKIEGILLGSLLVANKMDGEAFGEADLIYLENLAVIVAPYLRNVQKIAEYFESPLPEAALLAKYAQAGLIGKSAKFIALLKAIEAAARCEVRVLLEGPTGTGKELVAHAIHHFSARSENPFIAIDCGAIPPHLLESELFGHVRGAFTGAASDRKGLFEAAQHGTIFLDEISNLPMDMQVKLMRLLQQGEIRPVGSNQTRSIDVRMIAASSASLRDMMEQGNFREDLYYRLLVYPIFIPSLAERAADIPLLAHHFLKKFTQQQRKPVEDFHEEILDYFTRRHWKGNIRELEHIVERLVTLASPEITMIDRDLLPADLLKEFTNSHKTQPDAHVSKSLAESLAEYEEQLLRQALVAHQWSHAKAARALKIPPPTLRYKMQKMGITKPSR